MKLKTIKKMVGSFATTGYLLYLAAFTFVGTMLLTPLIGWGIAAIFFAVIVEGTVYAKNIFEAVLNSNYELVLELALAEENLKELQKTSQNTFVKDYFKLKNNLHFNSENLSAYNEADKEAAEKDIIAARKCLKIMLAQYKDYLKTSSDPDNSFQSIPSTKKTSAGAFSEIVEYRKIWMIGSMITSLFSGIFSGLSAYSLIMTNFMVSPLMLGYLAKIGVSVLFASTVYVPLLAGLAGLGSMLVMYGNASNVIKKGNLDQWLTRIHELTNSPSNENRNWKSQIWKYLKKFLGFLVFPSLLIFTTLAAAWSFGSPILIFTTNIALRTLTYITWPCMFGLTLVFDTDNALQSLKKIGKDLNTMWGKIKEDWKKRDSALQFILQLINPFQYARSLIMLWHSYSAGITTDNFPGIHPALTAFFEMLTEFLTDWHYGDSHTHPHNHGEHDTTKEQTHDHAAHSHEHDDDHDHGSFLDIPVTICNYIAVGWDYVFAIIAAIIVAMITFKWNYNNDLKTSKKKFLPSPKKPSFPSLSEATVALYYSKKLSKYEDKYRDDKDSESPTAKKSAAFKVINNSIEAAAANKKLTTIEDKLDECLKGDHVLRRHRHGIWSSPPDSQFYIVKLRNNPILTSSLKRFR